jgi:hypothetical protein
MNKRLLPILLIITTLPALAQQDTTTPPSKTVWSARQVSAELVEAVINGNLFVPDQRREPRVQPPPGDSASDESQTYGPTDPPIEYRAEDPDRSYRLIGTSFTGGRWLAFIENDQTREIHRVTVDESIASGTVTAINYNRIEYAANDQSRSVPIGRDLTGAEPPASLESDLSGLFATESASDVSTDSMDTQSQADNTPAATAPSTADDQRAEVLRRLRERRERESQ